MRPIDADALIKNISDDNAGYILSDRLSVIDIENYIDDMPTIDVELHKKEGKDMTNTEWIVLQTNYPESDWYLVNIHNISMIHYESHSVFLTGQTKPLHITGQSMEELCRTILKIM